MHTIHEIFVGWLGDKDTFVCLLCVLFFCVAIYLIYALSKVIFAISRYLGQMFVRTFMSSSYTKKKIDLIKKMDQDIKNLERDFPNECSIVRIVRIFQIGKKFGDSKIDFDSISHVLGEEKTNLFMHLHRLLGRSSDGINRGKVGSKIDSKTIHIAVLSSGYVNFKSADEFISDEKAGRNQNDLIFAKSICANYAADIIKHINRVLSGH